VLKNIILVLGFAALQNVVAYGSTYVLVALTIDRHDAITRPMNFYSGSQYIKHSSLCRLYGVAVLGFSLGGGTGVATLSFGGGRTTTTFVLNYRVCNRLYQIINT